jgi:hypothetical protein
VKTEGMSSRIPNIHRTTGLGFRAVLTDGTITQAVITRICT